MNVAVMCLLLFVKYFIDTKKVSRRVVKKYEYSEIQKRYIYRPHNLFRYARALRDRTEIIRPPSILCRFARLLLFGRLHHVFRFSAKEEKEEYKHVCAV